MRPYRATVTVLSAFLLLAPSVAFAQAPSQSQVPSSIMPVAVGALAGAATAFFILPLLVPSMAVVSVAGSSTTASPVIAAVGAGIGGLIGYEIQH